MAFSVNTPSFRRWLAPLCALLLVVQLAACGDKEAEQRAAFSDFLQHTALRSTGQLPVLSEAQKQTLGNYVGDYAILTTFAQQMTLAVEGSLAPAVTQIDQILVPQDYLRQLDNLQHSLGTLNLLGQQLQNAQSQADSARAALKQPDDLKKVYDQLYSKIVTQPVQVTMPLIQETTSVVQELVQVGNFLKAQGNQVSFNHEGIQLPTQALANQYNTMMTSLAAKYQRMLAARQKAASAAEQQ